MTTGAGPLRRWIVARVAEACFLDEDEVDPSLPLQDFGLSSRDAVELSGELEELLGRALPTTLLWDHPSIDRLVDALTDAQDGAGDEQGETSGSPDPSGDPIAVVGLGCRLPGGVRGPEQFWRLLTEGRDAVAEVPAARWAEYGPVPERVTRRGGFLDDVAGFDAEFFGIEPGEAARMDPQQRMLLEVAWEALEHAGIAPRTLSGSATGVFVGISGTEYGARSIGDIRAVDPWTATGAAPAIAANRLSYAFDLRGPSLSVDTACSSSLVAVHLAVRSLQSGECDLALVGGANLLLGPGITACFDEMGVSSADGRCKPFSADADGIVRAEGVGVVVLKRLSEATAAGDRVLARIRGTATNSDGRSGGLTAPHTEAQRALLRAAYRQAGIDPSTTDYVEAHGTGTLLGDPIEARALGTVLGAGRRRPLLLGSVKSNLGHLEAAAGIVGLIKTVLALHHRLVPPTLHHSAPHPHIPFGDLGLSVVDSVRPWPTTGRPALAGVSGFGFGGTNAHVVLEQEGLEQESLEQESLEQEGLEQERLERESGAGLPHGTRPWAARRRFLLGAASEGRLRENARALAEWVEGTQAEPADIEYTLARRLGGRHRAAVVARSRQELVEGLLAPAPENVPAPAQGPVFVFSGHGSQWAGMGRQLLAEEPVFAAAVDRLDPVVRAEAGFSLRDDLLAGVEATTMDHVQPMVFGVQVALAELWRHYGVRPAAVIGHSFGEVAAAVVAGALTEADGARVVALRSRLLASLAGDGAMALLEAGACEVAELSAHESGVSIAVLSSPGQTVIAGRPAPVSRIMARVEADGRLAHLVKLDVAAHSCLVDPVTPALVDGLTGIVVKPAAIPVYSTVVDGEPAFDPDYWAQNLRNPVRFSTAVAAAAQNGFGTFVELSPHPVLRHALSDNLADRSDALVLSSLRNCPDEAGYFHRQLATLELAAQAEPPREGRITDVPTTRWRHTRHWLPVPAAAPTTLAGAPLASAAAPPASAALPTDGHPLLGVHTELPDDGRHVWRADLGTAAHPWLADHRLDDRPVLPGPVYLEMAAAAASTAFGAPVEHIALRDVTTHRPLALDDHTTVTTTFAGGTIHVHTKAADGTWLLHASAGAAVAGPERPEACVPTVDDSEFLPVSSADLHRRLRLLGVSYGPGFTGMSSPRLSRGAGDRRVRAVADVALPEGTTWRPGLRLHPALVESCLQVFAAALHDPDATTVWMPVEYGTVRGYGDLTRGTQVHAWLAEDDEDDHDGGRTGEVRLVDEQGQVLLEMTGVVVRAVQHTEIAAPLTAKLLAAVWRPTPLAGSVRGDAHWARRIAGESILVLSERPTPLAAALGARQGGYGTRPDAGAVLFVLPHLAGLADAERAVLAVADATRELAESNRPPRLLLVTTGAFAVGPGETGNPAGASLRGLVRVLACERPELRLGIVDLDPLWTSDEAAAALRQELASGTDDEVAWRSGVRHARRLDRLPEARPATSPLVRRDGGYVITGGLGGLGIFLAGRLAHQGVGKIVLNGRSPAAPTVAEAIDKITERGTEVEVILGDIAEAGVAERLMAAAGRVRGVIHAAAVFDDHPTIRLDAETLHRSWLPKAYGAWRLHEVTRDLDLDWWLGFSSVAALHGLPGQPAYATGNAYLDALAEMRRAQGLPGTSIAWGAWAEIGAVAGLDIPWLHPIRPAEALEVLTAALGQDLAQVGALRLNTPALVTAFPQLAQVPFFEPLLRPYADSSDDWAGVAWLRGLSPEAARAAASSQLRSRIASVLGHPPDSLDITAPLPALGLDSLLAVRVRHAVQHDFDVTLPVSLLLRGASALETEQWLFGALDLNESDLNESDRGESGRKESHGSESNLDEGDLSDGSVPVAPAIEPRDSAERLVAGVWRDVLGVEVGVTKDFHEAGGDRSRAGRIAALLTERGGRELTTTELFEHPTIERMAVYLREEEHGGPSPRVLRGEGTKTPLFLFHPGGGDTVVYTQLTRLLDPDIPVYGFDRIDGVPAVEERVRQYLPELRAVQPHGPYRLAGWSFGGSLAFEAAQQLRRAGGERVEALMLIDSIIPLPCPTGLSDAELAEKQFERFVEFLETTYALTISLPYERLAGLDDEAQIQLVVDTMRAEGLVNSAVSDAILNHQRTSLLDARALERYTPRPYDGPVSFLSATDPTPGGLRDHRFDRRDPARSWDAVCSNLDVSTVPGHHLSLLDPPHVDSVARRLDAILAGGSSRPS
ncbi:beta-ketoacyl synthase N-terminal-like domain-containing protein [Streptomyces sp. NPDC046915]|uniref:beta-ketoacyl synthase N-terminal-like domain-containing protein n=1 Tax=Streptomyces sp. NPDC046915 TaxID=3155257 RepID=UPI0034033519